MATAIITHLKKDEKGDYIHENSKLVTTTTEIDLPIKFGYGSYNKPKKIIGPYQIDVDDVISIDIKE